MTRDSLLAASTALVLLTAPLSLAVPVAHADEAPADDEFDVPPPRREPPPPRRAPAAPPPPLAAEPEPQYGPRQGMWEATLTGSGINDNEFEAGGFGVSGSLGYFLTDRFEVLGRQSVTFADSDNGDAFVAGSTRVAADYHLPIGKRFYPYLGVNIGGVYGDGVDESFAAAPEAGLKIYALPTTFFFVQTEYQFVFESADEIDNAFDNGQFVYSLGIGFNW